jgi:glycosyltransferase involved in cell wall biosynthesis
MKQHSTPEMSVVIVTPDCYETISQTIRHLGTQTIRNCIELVIVAPSAEILHLDTSELENFLRYRVVEVGTIRSTAEARAAGVREASAEVVAFLEDHSYPAPGWAEALIEAHRQPWAAVGPVIANATPDSMISWANAFLGSNHYLEPASAGVVDDLPGRNSSYKRAILLDYGPELGAMLETETVLHWDLRARGYQLYLEPAARTSHRYFTLLSSLMREQWHVGRLFAASRGRRWSLLRRWLYAGGTVLIPPVRLWRILRELHRPGRQYDLLPRIMPTLVIGLVVSAVGEMIGYAFGPGHVSEQVCLLEFHRERH